MEFQKRSWPIRARVHIKARPNEGSPLHLYVRCEKQHIAFKSQRAVALCHRTVAGACERLCVRWPVLVDTYLSLARSSV